jgi:hypothetical protein
MSLYTIYSPQGEMFEVTRLNYLDLTSHAGWSNTPPSTSVAAIVAAETPQEPAAAPQAPEATAEAPQAPEAAPAAPEAAPADETTEETSEETAEKPAFDREAAEARYAALSKDDMRHLLKDQFGFDADGRTSLPKLVAKAVELEEAANA